MTSPADYMKQDLGRYYAVDNAMSARWRPMWTQIPEDAPVLVLGCGRGELVKQFPNALGVDFNPYLRPLWEELGIGERCGGWDVANLNSVDFSSFDWTVSIDFLEHVHPARMVDVLQFIQFAAPNGIHIIDAKTTTSFKGVDGGSLHPSGNSPEWWMDTMKRLIPHAKVGRHNMMVRAEWTKQNA